MPARSMSWLTDAAAAFGAAVECPVESVRQPVTITREAANRTGRDRVAMALTIVDRRRVDDDDRRLGCIAPARDRAELEQARRDLESRGIEVSAIVCDLADRAEARAL